MIVQLKNCINESVFIVDDTGELNDHTYFYPPTSGETSSWWKHDSKYAFYVSEEMYKNGFYLDNDEGEYVIYREFYLR